MSAYPSPGGGATDAIGPLDRGYKLMAQRRVSAEPPECVSLRHAWLLRSSSDDAGKTDLYVSA